MAQLLQVTHALYPQSDDEAACFTWESARALGGAVLSLTPQPDPQPAAWDGLCILTPETGEASLSAWHRALDTVQPAAVFVQQLGDLSPALLMDLRDRGIPYAVFLHDYTALCPTRRLWHRHEESCSGPGRTGWKCAWCVSGTLRRAAELPLRTVLYRHRPQTWQTALLRADALLAPSRFARDFWVQRGAPPERIAVIAPRLNIPVPPPTSSPPPNPRTLVFAGCDQADGLELFAGALDLLRAPVQVAFLGVCDDATRARLRATVAVRHAVQCHAVLSIAELRALLAASRAAVAAPRWEQPFSRLIAEAQTAGIRAVATARGGLAEQIIHGVNGFLAAPDDPQALAEAIQEALSAPDAAWAGSLTAANAAAAAGASTTALRRLLGLLAGGDTELDPTVALEHGEWLAEQAARDGQSPPEAAQTLVGALRDHADAPPLYLERAVSTTHLRQLHLNHAVAFFRGCGCRRIAAVNDHIAPDVVGCFSTWGLEIAPVSDLPDGIWWEDDTAADLERLKLRFPQAKAVVICTPDDVETVNWRDED